MALAAIEFLAAGHERYPPPRPASGDLPDWLRAMALREPHGPPGNLAPTLKNCPPFLDAICAGYLMPLAADLTLRRGVDGSLAFDSSLPLLGIQHQPQYKGAPFESQLVVKFLSPWVVRTPPGYSTLALPPLNRFHFPFQVLAGVIETDRHYQEIHYPAICLMAPGASLTLPRGTPIAQLVPIRREPWDSRVGELDPELIAADRAALAANPHHYKQQAWARKTYR